MMSRKTVLKMFSILIASAIIGSAVGASLSSVVLPTHRPSQTNSGTRQARSDPYYDRYRPLVDRVSTFGTIRPTCSRCSERKDSKPDSTDTYDTGDRYPDTDRRKARPNYSRYDDDKPISDRRNDQYDYRRYDDRRLDERRFDDRRYNMYNDYDRYARPRDFYDRRYDDVLPQRDPYYRDRELDYYGRRRPALYDDDRYDGYSDDVRRRPLYDDRFDYFNERGNGYDDRVFGGRQDVYAGRPQDRFDGYRGGWDDPYRSPGVGYEDPRSYYSNRGGNDYPSYGVSSGWHSVNERPRGWNVRGGPQDQGDPNRRIQNNDSGNIGGPAVGPGGNSFQHSTSTTSTTPESSYLFQREDSSRINTEITPSDSTSTTKHT